MTVSEEAQLHLAKAREFLEAAEASRDRKLYNAATSDASSRRSTPRMPSASH
jgi:uncharacterized protein (UPF0332 family)